MRNTVRGKMAACLKRCDHGNAHVVVRLVHRATIDTEGLRNVALPRMDPSGRYWSTVADVTELTIAQANG